MSSNAPAIAIETSILNGVMNWLRSRSLNFNSRELRIFTNRTLETVGLTDLPCVAVDMPTVSNRFHVSHDTLQFRATIPMLLAVSGTDQRQGLKDLMELQRLVLYSLFSSRGLANEDFGIFSKSGEVIAGERFFSESGFAQQIEFVNTGFHEAPNEHEF